MTYEQGGIDAGLGIKTSSGDTLTLADRLLHHYTSSIATIEVSANNAQQLVTEFKKYFDNNINGVGLENTTYVLTSSDQNKIEAVKKLLDNNSITYGVTSNNSFSGYNYFDNKTEAFKNEGYQIAVNTLQPKGRLVKVLFEQQSKLVDSATYDITAWSVPYAYGVNAWSVKDKLSLDAVSFNAGNYSNTKQLWCVDSLHFIQCIKSTCKPVVSKYSCSFCSRSFYI